MTQARATGLFYEPVDDVLGLLGLALFILCVIAIAAGVTFLVVRFSPKPAAKKTEPPSA
jgi:hypothetical protein